MTQDYHGIKTASDADLADAIERLHEQCLNNPVSSPQYKVAIRWLSATRKEIRERYASEWGNTFSYMTRDHGDEM